jgi:hypothetical protein
MEFYSSNELKIAGINKKRTGVLISRLVIARNWMKIARNGAGARLNWLN